MPEANLHFPTEDIARYVKTWDAGVRCAVMQGGKSDIEHSGLQRPAQARR
jgi:glucosamine-6-phosphate deaminase